MISQNQRRHAPEVSHITSVCGQSLFIIPQCSIIVHVKIRVICLFGKEKAMISNTYKIELPYASVFKESWCLVDIETEGRFWRTSRLLAARVITYGSPLEEYEWIAERESDEYDILSELAQVLMRSSCIMTFNGDSFDLPHLRKKYQAYRRRIRQRGKRLWTLCVP